MISRYIIVLVLGFHQLPLSEETLIIRYQHVLAEFQNRYHSEYYDENFLATYDVRERQEICEEVLAAREYMMIRRTSEVNTAQDTGEVLTAENTSGESSAKMLEKSSEDSSGGAQPLRKAASSDEKDGPGETSTQNVVRDTLSDKGSPRDQNIKVPPQKYAGRLTYAYRKRKIHAGVGIFANAIQCSNSEDKQWYIVYGFRRFDMFLLEYRKRARGLVVKALIPLSPSFNEYSGPSEILTSFLRNLEIGEHLQIRAPQNMNLCFLNPSQHLRVCASMFNLLISIGRFKEHARQINTVTTSKNIHCHIKTVQINAEILVTKVRALPCFINESEENHLYPQFYILPDLQLGIASAFVLTKVDDQDDDEKLEVTTKLDNVDVLFDVDFNSEIAFRDKSNTRRSKTRRKKQGQVDVGNSGQNEASPEQYYVPKTAIKKDVPVP